MQIQKVIALKRATLLIFYTSAHCYQFVIFSPDRVTRYSGFESRSLRVTRIPRVHSPDQIFYTPEAAESEGRQWLKLISN